MPDPAAPEPGPSRRVRTIHVDPSGGHPRPAARTVVVATLAALVGSILACAVLVWAGTRLVPSTAGYAHFRFTDYAPLTVVGVVGACMAWPVVARISPTPRWLLLRLAILVTAVLWIPDLVLLARHQPPGAVAVLMLMHLAVAVTTYQCLVRLAPPSIRPDGQAADPDRPVRLMATVLAVMVGGELVLGVVTLVVVPSGRPRGWLPGTGQAAYLIHSLVGLPLAVGAVLLVSKVRGSSRILGLGAWMGLTGVALAGIGGILTTSHPLRIVGIVLMLVGPVVAGFGYLVPVFDAMTEEEAPS